MRNIYNCSKRSGKEAPCVLLPCPWYLYTESTLSLRDVYSKEALMFAFLARTGTASVRTDSGAVRKPCTLFDSSYLTSRTIFLNFTLCKSFTQNRRSCWQIKTAVIQCSSTPFDRNMGNLKFTWKNKKLQKPAE